MSQPIAPFLIAIGPRAPGGAYPVRASCAGAEVTSALELPAPLTDLAERLGLAAQPLPDLAALGRALGRALFTPPLRDMLLRSARASAGAGQRLQLQLQLAPPELAALPWEWLSLGGERAWAPALRDDYALVRVSRGVPPCSPLALAGPLCVLALAAPGQELQLAALAEALAEPVRAGQIDLRLIGDATPAALEHGLAAWPAHVLHCAAPAARSDRGAPRLQLRRGLDLFDLAELLADAKHLRLLTLAGQQGDGSTFGGELPTLGAALLAPGLPATLALGGGLPARQAALFAARCYANLAAGQPIDLAAAAGRRALAEAGPRGWGMPQLRLAPESAQLFVPGRARGALLWPRRIAALGGLALAGALGAYLVGTRAEAPPGGAQFARVADLPTPALATIRLPTLTPSATPPPTATPAPTAEPTALPTTQPPMQLPPGGDVIRRGNPANPRVALTFDIEIDDRTLYGFLEVLRARGLHGTFFVTGRWVQAFPDAARAIVADGHEIGNHSLTHPSFSRIGLDGAASEIAITEQIVHDTTGASTRPYFRFPYGDFTPATAELVGQAGYLAFQWSADDGAIPGWLDWAAQHPAEANGGILLLHGRAETVAALPGWLDRLAALGLQPGTLGEALR